MYKSDMYIFIQLLSSVGNVQTALLEDSSWEDPQNYHLCAPWQAQCSCCQVHLWWSHISLVFASSLHERQDYMVSMITLWLSQWRTGNSVTPRSPTRREIHKASLHAFVAATCSASVIYNATRFCSLEIQETVLVKVNTYPAVYFLLSAWPT